jgi:hypothetical protein
MTLNPNGDFLDMQRLTPAELHSRLLDTAVQLTGKWDTVPAHDRKHVSVDYLGSDLDRLREVVIVLQAGSTAADELFGGPPKRPVDHLPVEIDLQDGEAPIILIRGNANATAH